MKHPSRPHSSPRTEKMKSVWCSGMKSRWICVPLSQPLPASPPEQIAMVDWMMLFPPPRRERLFQDDMQVADAIEICIHPERINYECLGN